MINMKKIIFSLSIIFLIIPSVTFSQKLKYGYIDANKILSEMPEIERANKELETYVAQINDYIKSKNEEYTTKLNDFKKTEASLSELIKQDKQNELNKMASDIQLFQQNAQNEINKKKQDLYQSAIVKLKESISSIAKENGFRFIIDNSNGQLLYCEEADNAENLVRKKLGIPVK
jgi:outer membrane protein